MTVYEFEHLDAVEIDDISYLQYRIYFYTFYLNSLGERAFLRVTPKLWYVLPQELCNSSSVDILKSKL